MSAQSFPLIGIDRNRNEYSREYPGKNPQDAAEKLASYYGYIEVLSDDKRMRRSGNGTWHRKPLFKTEMTHPQHEANKTLLGMLLDKQLLTTGPKIVRHLRDKGMTVSLVTDERTGKQSAKVDFPLLVNVSPEDRAKLREFVTPNLGLILDVLRAEDEKNKQWTPLDAPVDMFKGKTQREVMLSMLPQMPTPFTREDFEERLKASGYTTFAADTKRLVSALYYCARKRTGEIKLVGPSTFEVLEQYRHRKAVTESKPVEPAVATPEPPPIEQPVVQAATITEPPEAPIAPPQILAPTNPLVALMEFASQAMTGTNTPGQLAAKLKEAAGIYEMAQLDSLANLTAVINSVAEELIQQDTARQAMARSLTGRS